MKISLQLIYEVYLERTKSSFDLLNSFSYKNLHHVCPHEIVCDKQIKRHYITHGHKYLLCINEDYPSFKYFGNYHKNLFPIEI